jgi:uncharacterized membrane protein
MESFVISCLVVVLVVRWFWLRAKLEMIKARLDALSSAVYRAPVMEPVAPPPPRPAPPPPPPPRPPEPAPEAVVTRPELRSAPVPWTDMPRASAAPAGPPVAQESPSRASEDWEARVGGSWANKLGVFVIVIGLVSLLGYTYTHIGSAGRVALSYSCALAMLIAGVLMERRELYRTFACGLIGGGWAALYMTTYAIHAIDAAKILDNPLAAAVLLLLVAIGMIVHSLRYRSQTVTGLAYFIAFVTLAIGEVTAFSVAALVPLAASLLYVAQRNRWNRFALYGLIATYATVAMHKDTGVPLWEAQALFLVYWLLFEAFDLIQPDPWLLPLNGIGFLLLSGLKWSHAEPNSMWVFAAGSAALYLASTVARAHSGRWRSAVTFNAVLALAAIVLKLEHQWLAVGLLALGEIYYLAGVRFRSTYLRALAAAMFAGELLYLSIALAPFTAARTWEPVAAATAIAFYMNRALRPVDRLYGYCAAALAALVAGFEASPTWRGPVWMLMAAVPFGVGWWRRQVDFRLQGYGLGVLGAIAIAIYPPLPAASLALGAGLAYALVQCTLRSAEDRFLDAEREIVRVAASRLTNAGLAALVWRLSPGDWLGVAWLALAFVILEAGLRDQPTEFRWQSYAIAILGAGRAIAFDFENPVALLDAALLYAFAIRAKDEDNGVVLDLATFPAILLLMAGFTTVLPRPAVTGFGALVALVLSQFDRRSLRAQSVLAAAAVFVRAMIHDLGMPDPVISIVPAIVCLEGAMLRRPQGSWMRMYFSLMATALVTALIFHEVSGSVLTIAWGIEGVALLAAGFALVDRVLRLSGLALLAVCVGKLFFWDLRNLDTLPRILSFIVLGLLLVAVSWVYTRFRDQVRRMV